MANRVAALKNPYAVNFQLFDDHLYLFNRFSWKGKRNVNILYHASSYKWYNGRLPTALQWFQPLREY